MPVLPLRPSARAGQDLVDQFPGIFKLDDLIGYVDDPDLWLPEWSLEARPFKVSQSDNCVVNGRHTGYYMGDGQVPYRKTTRNKMSTQNENDTQATPATTETRAPLKRTAKPKAPKAERAPKVEFVMPEEGQVVIDGMRAFVTADPINRRILASFVKEAISARAEAKGLREEAGMDDEG